MTAFSPFDLPFFFLESFMNRLGYAGFHEIYISNHLWCKRVTQMLVKTAVLQIICRCKSELVGTFNSKM